MFLRSLSELYSWYTTSGPHDSEVLIALSGTAAVVWAGSLIAFTLNRRYTVRLGFGLDYIAQCFYVPLALLALPAPLFRFAAWLLASAFALLTILLLVFLLRFRQIRKYKLEFSWTTEDKEVGQSAELKTKINAAVELVEDNFYRVVYGGPYLSVTTVAYVFIGLFPSERAALTIYIVMLYIGFQLSYGQITPSMDQPQKRVPFREVLRIVLKLFAWRKPTNGKRETPKREDSATSIDVQTTQPTPPTPPTHEA